MEIIIITHKTVGLYKDAELYKKYLVKNKCSVNIITVYYNTNIDSNTDKPFKYNPINILLFLENIPENINSYKAKQIWFMPNYELFNIDKHIKKLDYINYILCKTKITLEMFKFLKQEHNLTYKLLYTKFSSHIPKYLKLNPIKDPNLFVLLAGTSPYKNTAYLVYNWIRNNGYMDLDKDIKLYITCTQRCFTGMIEDLNNYLELEHKYNIFYDNTEQDTFVYKNMTIYNKIIETREYDYLLSCANVVICPSSKEGYSHNINEARYFNSFVITNDFRPMNELIKDGDNGLLIKKLDKNKKIYKSSKYVLYTVYPDLDELTKKIIYCIKNKNNLNTNLNSRKYFMDDLRFFKKKIKKLIKNI